ncbi:glycine/D-amino acid oxidase-like deaminating enzyme [Pseudochrobactrum saccharolyticum]|uniref:Glycine/D-amino acid oxidase-like deaminating enzyme n=1 Tax=Pseudochrobactrum saccharolyticum TaxID=354352 RepID=A0A7W8ENH4_9HYPH|nr:MULTISPECIES: FAD-dependent oxidoreductase [Pseudochrobactrum]MBX8785209.1 FAD-binding oxidoreductase [Ochrobactrum sp. GRS2]HWD14145.1 FAD-dependent oxidoreductase [Pseudochrobactrum sp.]KAB0538227.1 FAD-binding oxidoreductase [Pseudochrobactrum saccharolyticum]MBB5091470.1 glycine/D-amino acid oxidase-like deaminating enzyme [Pseudochrobactrum saccharolyticum]UCA47558.1 FAD-binding oxidoreductase [Pseudochrobactrum sp. XF203]
MKKTGVTVEKKLRVSLPYWQTTPHISVRTRKTASTRNFDIIIVGAGISGALVAEALTGHKRKIAIMDKRTPVHGSTMASTAMLQHEIDLPLHKMVQHTGTLQAETIWQRSVNAVSDLHKLIKKHGIHCQMQHKSALYLAGDKYGKRALLTETKARNSAQIDARYLDQKSLKTEFNINRTAGIVSTYSASANPAQMTAGLLKLVQKHGAEIIQDIEITDFVSLNDQVILATSAGEIYSAKFVIFCTGYEFLQSLKNKNHQIISTWALASRKNIRLPHWLNDFLVWEGSDPYLYFRTGYDGRLIAGGEDTESPEAYKDPQLLAEKTNTIAEKISTLLNINIGTPAFRWAAAFGDTKLGIPMIGEVPDHKNVFAVMGYGGNGITFSKIAADIISAKLKGQSDPVENLFKFR